MRCEWKLKILKKFRNIEYECWIIFLNILYIYDHFYIYVSRRNVKFLLIDYFYFLVRKQTNFSSNRIIIHVPLSDNFSQVILESINIESNLIRNDLKPTKMYDKYCEKFTFHSKKKSCVPCSIEIFISHTKLNINFHNQN